jgi:hypothetical protein
MTGWEIMAEIQKQTHRERLIELVACMIGKLEKVMMQPEGECDDAANLRLFGAKKSYADVLVDLCEVMIKLEASANSAAHGKAMVHSAPLSQMHEQDFSLIKYYIQRQRQLTAQAASERSALTDATDIAPPL